MNDREAYIALNMMERVGPVTVGLLVETFGSALAAFSVSESKIRQVSGAGRVQLDAFVSQRETVDWAAELELADSKSIRIITQVDSEYPALLKAIYDPPLALYVRGSLLTRDKNAVAVVGSRRTTSYGKMMAERISADLAAAGYTVVSGLAEGIDTEAHRAAITARGRTIAVLGSGLDCVFPVSNIELAEEIPERGAVISEFPLGRHADKTTFPMRNRIVSGLSKGVVVVEAGRKSGALITAGQALEQGRDVFAVPGRVDSRNSMGCHDLIRKGARLITGASDIAEEYEFLLPNLLGRGDLPPQGPPLSDNEQVVIDLLMNGEQAVDSLIRQSGLGASVVNSVLLGLELKKKVRMLPGRMVEAIAEHVY